MRATELLVVEIEVLLEVVPLFNATPCGSAPDCTVHVRGPVVAGDAVRLWFVGVPTDKAPSEVGVIASTA